MAKCARDCFGSPSSLHRFGLDARAALTTAREQIADLINAESPEEIIFTASAAESANLAIVGTVEASRRFGGKRVVTSEAEHPSVIDPALALKDSGIECEEAGVNSVGAINPGRVESVLGDDCLLLATHHANHDLGTIQPVARLGEIAAEKGAPFFVDASFSGGWLPVDVRAMKASLLSLEPNRFHGPKGVGVLYRHRRARIHPIIRGGSQEDGRRAGEENLPAIVGAGVAAEIAKRELGHRRESVGRIQARLWNGLRERVPHVQLNGPGPGEERLPTNLNVSVEFVEGEGVALRADLKGLAIGSGSACVSKALKVPRALAAIGLDPSLAQGCVILSPGAMNLEAEADEAAGILAGVVEDLRGMSPTWEEFKAGRRDPRA